MTSGLYIVTLNNRTPISVNAHDPRIAHKTIQVTKDNCKVGKAKNLEARRKNYAKTFGEHNVNYAPIARLDDIKAAEKAVLAALDAYRIRGAGGRKNEWLAGIDAQTVRTIALEALNASCITHEVLSEDVVSPRDNVCRADDATAETVRESSADYAGQYRIAKTPKRLASHNEASWEKIEKLISKKGGSADFDQLTAAVQGHRHYGTEAKNPHQFVTYCIRRGWLERIL